MSDAKHTPGPWAVFTPHDPANRPGIDASGPPCFSVVIFGVAEDGGDQCGVYGRTPDERAANARLIAAAPDLLAACDSGLAFVNHTLEFFGWGQFPSLQEAAERLRDKMAAAIAKAKGLP